MEHKHSHLVGKKVTFVQLASSNSILSDNFYKLKKSGRHN